jgi:beta-lactamase regulating signal transducer with metallopeptidase domain
MNMETISRYLLTFLINSLWQLPLIAAVALLAAKLLRNGPALHRHALWAASLIACVLLPLASIRASEGTAPMRITVTFAPQAPSITPAATGAAAQTRPIAKAPGIAFAKDGATALLVIYLLFVLFRVAQFFSAWMRTVQLRRAARDCNLPPLLEQVRARCVDALGVRDVEVLTAACLTSPATVGAARPAIILPESLLAETSEDVFTAAIGHEMAHIARHDFAWNLFYELVYAPLAFHPATWLIRRRIDQTREIACDELVTGRLINSGAYARSIITIAAATLAPARPGCALGVFDGNILEERVRRLLNGNSLGLKRSLLLLAGSVSALAVCVVAASSFAFSARAQSASGAEMKMAGDAYNGGNFPSAVEHFENAVKLDPANVSARLFLANALIREFFAEKASPESPLLARARQQYLEILSREPGNKIGIQGMVAVSMNSKKLSEGREWALKLVESDAGDKAGYYTVGVLDWAIIYPEFIAAKQAAGVPQQEYFIPDATVRRTLRDRFTPQVEEGARMLQTALQIDPEYSDAMAYMNLLERLKSEMAENASESADLMAKADGWVGRAIAAKRRQGQTQQPPAQLDVDGPPPGPPGAHAIVAAPPPPPPPPPPPRANP